MSGSMYQATIPVFVRMLENLSAILAQAENYAEERKIEPAVLINSRLAPDMFALSQQVQIAADMAKSCAARLACVEIPKYPDNETTFDQLQERLAKTIDFLKGFKATQIDGNEERKITLKMKNEEITVGAK